MCKICLDGEVRCDLGLVCGSVSGAGRAVWLADWKLIVVQIGLSRRGQNTAYGIQARFWGHWGECLELGEDCMDSSGYILEKLESSFKIFCVLKCNCISCFCYYCDKNKRKKTREKLFHLHSLRRQRQIWWGKHDRFYGYLQLWQ